ncbi:MAG: tetratricopeptide repeat protein [Treponema sp.]|nr:tetratricopeptide repeat protein [Treponema sp.]
MIYKKLAIILFSLCILLFSLSGCASAAASAEEYYSIGMAYFELGRYEEAEKWLNRARQADRTMIASTYNLGRLAYEQKRYEEATRHFESILRIDADNVLALKAAAYSRIMMRDFPSAEKHYTRLFELVPESADSGYNHALVLHALGRHAEAQIVLERYPSSLLENKDNLLLYARIQAAQNKVEAINSFTSYLSENSNPLARYEYAQVLEHHQFFARALEEFRKALSETPAASLNPKRSDIRFSIARILLTADNNSEGIAELQTAVNDGFNDRAAVERLLTRVSAAHREPVRNILSSMRN